MSIFSGLNSITKERPVVMITAYDYPFARFCAEAGVDVLLVGDSVGMVMHGLPDTTGVTMEMMEMHVAAVARAQTSLPIIGDLPFQSYLEPQQAIHNSRRLLAAGASAVKLEGGTAVEEIIQALVAEGIPVMGHLGMLPQSIHIEGGKYKKKGKNAEEIKRLHEDCQSMVLCGIEWVIFESIHAELSTQLNATYPFHTIGIGAGNHCDGQVLVLHDILGLYPWFKPPFAKTQAEIGAAVVEAIARYCQEVRALQRHS
jgi:3-methyl-2-oxobutanoate hydroxymethyltransferase